MSDTPAPQPGPDDTPPPSTAKTALTQPEVAAVADAPPDSPPLPLEKFNLVFESVKDQRWRRIARSGIVLLGCFVVVWFTCSLTKVVGEVSAGFSNILSKETLTALVAAEVKAAHADAASAVANAASGASSSQPQQPAKKEAKVSKPVQSGDTKESAPKVDVDLKRLADLRDLFLPVVAMVSLLTVAVVVILVTMLRASFAPTVPALDRESDKSLLDLPVPIIEAMKSFVDALKGLVGK